MYIFKNKFTTFSNKVYLTNSSSFRAFHWNLVLVEIKCCLKKAKHTLVFLETCNFPSRKWTLPNHPNLRYFIIQMSAHECFSNHFYTLNNIQKACNLDTKLSCFAWGLLVFSFPLQCSESLWLHNPFDICNWLPIFNIKLQRKITKKQLPVLEFC